MPQIWLREQARKVRAPREPGSNILASEVPLVPAKVLDAVAELLASAPIGPGLDDG